MNTTNNTPAKNSTEKVTAAMLVIGNEVLSGRTQDANIRHVGVELGLIGIQLAEVRIVADIEQDIVDAINALRKRYKYVFTSGGIGPTHDDITSDSIAKAFGVANTPHPVGFQLLADFYAAKGVEFNSARQRMGHTPEGAELIKNNISMAPGYCMDNVYVMAGVPRIMRDMLTGIIPKLEGGAVVKSQAISTNLPEGILAEHLQAIENDFAGKIDIGSYPKDRKGNNQYKVSLIIRSNDEKALSDSVAQLKAKLLELGGQVVDGEADDDDELEGSSHP